MAAKKNDKPLGFGDLLPPFARLKPGQPSHRPPALNSEIGKKMRAMYDDLLQQPVPDRFVELLKQIDQARENKRDDH